MVAVAVSVYLLFASFVQLRLYYSRIYIIVNFAVQFISARVFFAVQDNINICRSKRLSTIKNTSFGKVFGNFFASFAGSISFKYFFDNRTFFFVNIDFFLFGIIPVIKFTCTV